MEILEKNSTNGFFVMDMDKYKDLDKNIIVPMNLVETYDINMIHSGDFLNAVFLNSMIQNRINVVKNILI